MFEFGWKAGPFIFSPSSWNAGNVELSMKSLILIFLFNSPQGACPVCHGFGDLAVLDENKIVPDKNKSLEEGAIEPWTKPASRGLQKELLREARKRGISTSLPFSRLKPEQQKFILEGGDGYYGVKGFFDWLESKKYKVQVRVLLSRYRQFVPCPACYRTRLNEKPWP